LQKIRATFTLFSFAIGKSKGKEGIDAFRSAVIRPFVNELTQRVSKSADIATPEERALQAVPLSQFQAQKKLVFSCSQISGQAYRFEILQRTQRTRF